LDAGSWALGTVVFVNGIPITRLLITEFHVRLLDESWILDAFSLILAMSDAIELARELKTKKALTIYQ